MHDKPLLILLAICCLAVVAILATGIGGFARGGEFNRKHGNRLMRWRLIAQAIAIAVFLIYLWARG
ncbi:twin transmembrane helix small protein [Paracoccus aestuariivivens]|uniref:Twin transmembrane helix small protein n=1 Tax=Paracoccus aestuariivivens TaxID=1820333 RepID=A0A6L6J7X1_9RHOB|nr:twin transmembrane helix small protein [Paracoccus aestuariivivens]MTH76717.1 twin transmembrane helix small protein [Paracoccus aestuariivivens]